LFYWSQKRLRGDCFDHMNPESQLGRIASLGELRDSAPEISLRSKRRKTFTDKFEYEVSDRRFRALQCTLVPLRQPA